MSFQITIPKLPKLPKLPKFSEVEEAKNFLAEYDPANGKVLEFMSTKRLGNFFQDIDRSMESCKSVDKNSVISKNDRALIDLLIKTNLDSSIPKKNFLKELWILLVMFGKKCNQ